MPTRLLLPWALSASPGAPVTPTCLWPPGRTPGSAHGSDTPAAHARDVALAGDIRGQGTEPAARTPGRGDAGLSPTGTSPCLRPRPTRRFVAGPRTPLTQSSGVPGTAHTRVVIQVSWEEEAPWGSGVCPSWTERGSPGETFDLARPWICLFPRRLAQTPILVPPGPPLGVHPPLRTTQQPSRLTLCCVLAADPRARQGP